MQTIDDSEFFEFIDSESCDLSSKRWAKDYVLQHRQRIRWDLNYISENIRPMSLLNVGGAPFYFEYLYSQYGGDAKITALDLDPDRFPVLTKSSGAVVQNLDIENATAERLVVLSSAFDLVVFNEVFEHLRINIIKTMKDIRSLLSENGVIYMTTPNGLGLLSFIRLLKRRTGPSLVKEWSKLERLGHMGHVREYSALEICEILEYVGFRIEKKIYRRHHNAGRGLRGAIIRSVESILPGLRHNIVIVARKS